MVTEHTNTTPFTPPFDLSFVQQQLAYRLGSIWIEELAGTFEDFHVVQKSFLKEGKLCIDLLFPTFALQKEAELVQKANQIVLDVLPLLFPVEINVYADVKPVTKQSIFNPGISDVRNILLVASGKGGVGKSTVASNLAVALARLGCRVGLVDADVYGPSIPGMFGIVEQEPIQAFQAEGVKEPFMVPLTRYGIRLMSIGFLVDTSQPMIWRGPMIASASMQMFQQVAWGDLDYLVVDLPPGTGDIQLTISQRLSIAGAIVVSTPQQVALADVKRAKAMFDRVNIPVLGVVENMSYFVCGNCQTKHDVFTHGGARTMAMESDLPFLAEIPLEPHVREGSDGGKPSVLQQPESISGKAFFQLAHEVAIRLAKMAIQNPHRADPNPQVQQKKAKKGLPVLA